MPSSTLNPPLLPKRGQGLVSAHVVAAPLLGAPHLRHRRPARAYFQGDVSPESDPGRYVEAVRRLVSWYWRDAATATAADGGGGGGVGGGSGGGAQAQAQAPPPLVVNTHGWIAGLGLELTAEVLRAAAPTHGEGEGAEAEGEEEGWGYERSNRSACSPQGVPVTTAAFD